jgi:hypothetical protein
MSVDGFLHKLCVLSLLGCLRLCRQLQAVRQEHLHVLVAADHFLLGPDIINAKLLLTLPQAWHNRVHAAFSSVGASVDGTQPQS